MGGGVEEALPGGGPLLDWVAELLDLPREAGTALLDGSFEEALATAPWHAAMFKVNGGRGSKKVAQGIPVVVVGGIYVGGGSGVHGGASHASAAGIGAPTPNPCPPSHTALQAIAGVCAGVYDVIKAAVKEAVLVVLAPGQVVVQTSTQVRGSGWGWGVGTHVCGGAGACIAKLQACCQSVVREAVA